MPEAQRSSASVYLRYEDVAQDGRVLLTALPHGTGPIVWRNLLRDHPLTGARNRAGIVAVLTRMVIEGGGGPVSAIRPLEGEGCYQLAHTVDEHGQVHRLVLNMWVDLYGSVARMHGPPPDNHHERVFVGRVFGENTFTRLFAEPGRRQVTEFELSDEEAASQPRVPPDRYAWRNLEAAAELPEGAAPLEDRVRPGPQPVALGIGDTDSNQHVNSMVYPRLFERAALQRFIELGRSACLLSRRVEIAYRKPCFAGQLVEIHLRAYRLADQLGAVGWIASPDTARPHCWLNMLFSE